MNKRITILYTDAGGGHLATAKALKAVLESSGPYDVSIINVYKEIIDELDIFKFTSYSGEDIYNQFIQEKGYSGIFCLTFYGLLMGTILLKRKRGIELLEEYWKKETPDLVISVIPMMNTVISQSLERFKIPLLIVMTDLREPSKYVWYPKSELPIVLCGTRDAYEDGLKNPHPTEKIHQLSGLVINPSFYDFEPIDQKEERLKNGLSENLTTGCILYGGSGSGRMIELAKVLQKIHSSNKDFQIIFLCGHSKSVASKIEALKLPFAHIIVGYTNKMPYYMQLADFMIGKPGPGFISESLVMKCPLLIDRKNVLLQERYNIKWLKMHKMGTSFKSLTSFKKEFNNLLNPEKLNEIKQEVNKHLNQAVFEVCPIINSLLEKSTSLKKEIKD